MENKVTSTFKDNPKPNGFVTVLILLFSIACFAFSFKGLIDNYNKEKENPKHYYNNNTHYIIFENTGIINVTRDSVFRLCIRENK